MVNEQKGSNRGLKLGQGHKFRSFTDIFIRNRRRSCGMDGAQVRPWANWQDTVRIEYGDVLAVTWFGECRGHTVDWDMLRIDLVMTNGSGGFETNSSILKMKTGYNFAVNYIYWHTNGGSLLPTNFTVAEMPVLIRTTLAPVVTVPAGLR